MTRKHSLLAGVSMTAAERAAGRFLRAPDGHPDPTPAPAASEGAQDDPFTAAFAEHAAEGETSAEGGDSGAPAAPAEGEAPAEGTPAPEGEAPAGESGEGAPAQPDGEKPPVEGGAPEAAPPAGAPSPDDILNRLAGLINQSPAQPEAHEAPVQPAVEAPLYTTDEQELLQEYVKNWPDVSRAEQLIRRAEYHDLMKYMFEQVREYVGPMADQVRAMGNNLHISEVKQAVPEYDDALEQSVVAWVDTQPSYLQVGMKQVIQSGTSEEITDLIRRYWADTGTAPAPAPAAAALAAAAPEQSPAPTPVKPVKTELSSAAKQAAESLAPVSGERSQVPQGEDPNDFETAFSKHAAAAMQ